MATYGIPSEFPNCNFARDSYDFVGWNIDPNATEGMPEYSNLANTDGAEVTVYAIWKQKKS